MFLLDFEKKVYDVEKVFHHKIRLHFSSSPPPLLSPKDKGQVTHPKIIIFNEMRGNCQKDSGEARLSAQWAKSFRMFFEKFKGYKYRNCAAVG